jgi:hypothetical protein
MRIQTILVAICLASGCASTYKQDVLTTPTAKLQQRKSIAIATPRNGSYEGKDYAGSGSSTALALRAAFARYSNNITVSSECVDLACLQRSPLSSADYLVIPEILHWEDRSTEWSGKKDKLEVKVVVYSGQDGREVATTIISGKSKLMSFGGDHPQDLLAEPIGQYVDSLY